MNHDSPDARAAALDLLQGVIRRKQALDQQMTGGAFAALDPRGRAFAHNLVATTLRRLGQIDALISACLEKPLPANARTAQDILRLGAAQLLFTGTADHAAVDTAVDLARARGQGRLAKLVNAVLRRLQREGAAALAGQDAARLNTPDWLWQAWEAAYGADICRAIAESHLTPAPLDITVKDDAAGWAERLGGTALSDHSLRLTDAAPVPELPGFAEGAWWVQDRAAALPVRLLGDVAGLSVLDLCAAPGGKTAQLAAGGARVTALDRSEKRLETLARNLDRLELQVETVAADALSWDAPTRFDAILLDAPCSATGTIRRHPDLPHLKRPEDTAKLADLQDRLLARAADWVRPGGVLIFATCSLQPEEGPERVRAFLNRQADFKTEPATPGESGVTPDMLSPEGWLRTLPSMAVEIGGMDGFFAAALRRIAY
ncbi:MAG TPA: 16S rRNA (cytosine(967)-C(5))-methyltransferase, partial [Rhodospirillaceae bacterium]|nr:16S rRNA (cytosine(967)-C(5))-methyltransferase [Rhodospirillaceae bacterium]